MMGAGSGVRSEIEVKIVPREKDRVIPCCRLRRYGRRWPADFFLMRVRFHPWARIRRQQEEKPLPRATQGFGYLGRIAQRQAAVMFHDSPVTALYRKNAAKNGFMMASSFASRHARPPLMDDPVSGLPKHPTHRFVDKILTRSAC
jgi:hypothetical protein